MSIDKNGTTWRQVYVKNVGTKELVEDFKGERIRIPKGAKIKMSRNEAAQFRGQFPGAGIEKALEIIPIMPETEKAKK